MDSDEQRARARQRRNDERAARFMMSKSRTIGIDKASLDRQLQEKNKKMLKERCDSIIEDEYQSNFTRFWEESELAEQRRKATQAEEVRQTILQQMKLPKNNALSRGDPLDFTSCGVSSAQCFAGEDSRNVERTKKQKEQIKDWCAAQMNEKRQKQRNEDAANIAYAKYILAEDEMRGALALEDTKLRSSFAKAVQCENLRRSEEIMSRNIKGVDKYRREDDETQSPTLPSEGVPVLNSASAESRHRSDEFKGFNRDVIEKIYRENSKVIDERRGKEREEMEYEKKWSDHQKKAIAELEAVEEERLAEVKRCDLQLGAQLKKQREELKEKKARMRSDRFGTVGVGFFQRFGTSCR